MPRIPWTTYSGDDVEAYAAMCIYRERPHALRIRPSVGDGGIDVYVDLGDNRVDVYQVKKYAENLKPKQLGDIKKSYNRIKAYAKERKWKLATWYLVLPLDPTKENDKWLEDLNKDDPFDARWWGLTVFDNWNSDYPQVADHFFNGGRERLATELERFAGTTLIMLPGVDPDAAKRTFSTLEPAGVLDRLALLNTTLNSADPFYQYQISVGHSMAAPPYTGRDGYPALVATYSRSVKGQTVKVHVFARFAESTSERPITFKATIVVPAGGDEEREWRQFLDYGRPPSEPITVRNLVADLPGGLGDTAEEALMYVLPTEDGLEAYERKLSVIDPSGTTLSEVDVTFTERGYSTDNTGAFARGGDRSGMLSVELLSKIDDGMINVTYNFELADDTGRLPRDVRKVLAFTNNFFAPNRLRVADPLVPRRATEQPIPTVAPGDEEKSSSEQYIRYLDALDTIQQHADEAIFVPDPGAMDTHDYVSIMRAGRLLAGETIEFGWDSLTVILNPDAAAIDDDKPRALIADIPLVVSVGAQEIVLGMVRHVVEAAEVSSRIHTEDGVTKVVMRPALGKTQLRAMWAGPDSIDRLKQRSN